MKVTIIGATGMLGTDCAHSFEAVGFSVTRLSSTDIDITSRQSISGCLDSRTKPDFLINCAAYTAVDLCETHQEMAQMVNSVGPKNLALWCRDHDVPMIHFSTDYIFDGHASEAYSETDPPSPLSVYGESKLQGERAVMKTQPNSYVFRVQWLYGAHGNHFIKTILNLAKTRPEIKVVHDQWGSPTWTCDIAEMLVWVIKNRPPFGIYHWHNDGFCTWYDLARFAVKQCAPDVTVNSCETRDFPRPAHRPANGRLSLDRFLTIPNAPRPRRWQDAVTEFLNSTPQ